MDLPKGPYRLVLADPPWLYRDARTHASAGMARSAYPCLSQAEIAAMPVGAMAAGQSALALWSTLPKLPEALAVMGAWGFAYATVGFVWVKTNPRAGITLYDGDGEPVERAYPPSGLVAGLGHYTRANCELVLLGRKGKRALPRVDLTVRQVVLAPRGRHSAKPPAVRERLVRLFGDVDRVELFARERVPGWDSWGAELEVAA